MTALPPKRRKMPAQKPSTSEQTVGTPPDFIRALEYRFGPIAWDLCATPENSVVPGKFFDVERDGLKQDWGAIDGNLWCNPEFGDIPRWLRKAVEEATPRARVFVLTPASLDANWWWEFCRPHAITYSLKPRLQFVGHKNAAPKGLALHLFGMGAQGLGRWAWKATLAEALEETPTDCRPPIEGKTDEQLKAEGWTVMEGENGMKLKAKKKGGRR